MNANPVKDKPALNKFSKPTKVNPRNIQAKPEVKLNSTPVNISLWLATVSIVLGVSTFNQLYSQEASPIVRLIVVILSIALALGTFAITNQGKKLFKFGLESLLELKKIYWPTRKEALQTSVIVVIISIITSFLFFFLDSVIQFVVTLITTWSF